MSRPPPSNRLWALAAGPAAAALVLLLDPGGDPGASSDVARMLALVAWMAVWWVTEAVPVAVTALLPLVLMPLAGLAPVATVARDYGRETIFLFLGGFLLAIGLQQSGAHRRIALAIVGAIGSRPRRLVLGFLLAATCLSMGLSNTSTTLLLLPIALSVLETARTQGADPALLRRLAVPLLLGLAHGATIGGLATPIGTPTNLVFRQLYPQLFPDGPAVSFLDWMLFGVPLALAFAVIAWWLLVRVIFPLPDTEIFGAVAELRRQLGPVRRDERVAGGVFAATALLWVTGQGLDFGTFALPGWQSWAPLGGRVDDHVVAIGMAILLFALPSQSRPGERLLEWRHAAEVPWGVLLLFGGGFALASGIASSGAALWVGGLFQGLQELPFAAVLLITCVALVALSEFASNTASAQIALPILASAATALQVDPRALMIPATLAASCAFMMPVGTPPISIVYATGQIPMRDLVRAGLWLNLLGLALVIAVFYLIAAPLLGISLDSLPAWAFR
ncbi:MAG: SLC13 family permease [Planctomycetota bacterium]